MQLGESIGFNLNRFIRILLTGSVYHDFYKDFNENQACWW